MTTRSFGAKVPRVEDQRLLRGRGRYVDDVLRAAEIRRSGGFETVAAQPPQPPEDGT